MEIQDSGAAAWYHQSTGHGEPAVVGDGAVEGFLEMFGDRPSSDDLFELVWHGGGGDNSMDHGLPISPEPPSEDEMAAWLYPIVLGDVKPVAGSLDQPACGNIIGGSAERDQLKMPSNPAMKTEVNCTEDKGSDSSHMRKPAAGGRRSHQSETHNLTEKRRRWKINEKLKTLQQLVPGCNKEKCNQACILDKTIQYMKSLQQQIQAMDIGCSMRSAPAAVTCGVPQLPRAAISSGMLVRGQVRSGNNVLAPPMALFAPMVPLAPCHPAVMVHTSPMLPYPITVVPNLASALAQNQG